MKKTLLTGMAALAIATTAVVAGDVVATVNGQPITKSDIQQVLQMVDPTGKLEWDKLDKAKKEEYVRMLAPSKLMAERAQKELTPQEKEGVLAGYWMQKKMEEMKVDEKELKEAYDKIKASYVAQQTDKKTAESQFPPFEMLKPQLEAKLKQDKLIESLMKDAKIEVK